MSFNQIIMDIENKAASIIKPEQGDYINDADGLLYCGKCHTRKQTRVHIFGRERTPYCLCRCEEEKRQKEEEERKHLEFLARTKELRKAGFPESDMGKWTFENDDGSNEKATKVMRNYVNNFEQMKKDGKGLLIYGTTGTGKTFAAACVANALIDKGYPVLMTQFSRVRDTVQGMFEGRQEYFDNFNRFPLLILDDLAAESKSDYMQEIVYKVIDSRYRAGLPLIVTTNLTADEIKNPKEMNYQRTFSRLLEMCIPFEMAGADRRREKLKQDFNAYKEVLGI